MNSSNELKVQMSKALKYHKAGLVDQAIPIYKKVLELYPDFVDANHLLGVALHESGHLERAFGFLTKAIKAVPDPIAILIEIKSEKFVEKNKVNEIPRKNPK